MKAVNQRRLNNNAAIAITNLAMPNSVVAYSESIDISKNEGFFALRVVENHAGGTGVVNIAAQYSDDTINWDTAYTSDLAGNLTQEGNIVTGLGNVIRRIVFTARMAKYLRLVFTPTADSVVTCDIIYQEEFAGL